MASINHKLFEQDVLDQRARLILAEQGVLKPVQQQLAALFAKWKAELLAAVKQPGVPLSETRLSELRRRAAILSRMGRLTGSTLKQVEKYLAPKVVGVYKSEFYRQSYLYNANKLSTAGAVTLNFGGLSDRAAQAALQQAKLPGLNLVKGFKTITDKAAATLRRDVATAIAEGWTVDRLAQRWSTGLGAGVLSRDLEALSITALHSSANAASVALYKENPHLVAGVRWDATFDTRTCMVCASRHGRVWSTADAPACPAHFRCRCTLLPVFLDDESEKAARQLVAYQTGGQVNYKQGDARFSSWLGTLDPQAQRDFFPSRLKFEAWKQGVPIHLLVGVDGTLTDPQVQSLLDTSWKKAAAAAAKAENVRTTAVLTAASDNADAYYLDAAKAQVEKEFETEDFGFILPDDGPLLDGGVFAKSEGVPGAPSLSAQAAADALQKITPKLTTLPLVKFTNFADIPGDLYSIRLPVKAVPELKALAPAQLFELGFVPVPKDFNGLSFADAKLLQQHNPEAYKLYKQHINNYNKNVALAKKLAADPSALPKPIATPAAAKPVVNYPPDTPGPYTPEELDAPAVQAPKTKAPKAAAPKAQGYVPEELDPDLPDAANEFNNLDPSEVAAELAAKKAAKLVAQQAAEKPALTANQIKLGELVEKYGHAETINPADIPAGDLDFLKTEDPVFYKQVLEAMKAHIKTPPAPVGGTEELVAKIKATLAPPKPSLIETLQAKAGVDGLDLDTLTAAEIDQLNIIKVNNPTLYSELMVGKDTAAKWAAKLADPTGEKTKAAAAEAAALQAASDASKKIAQLAALATEEAEAAKLVLGTPVAHFADKTVFIKAKQFQEFADIPAGYTIRLPKSALPELKALPPQQLFDLGFNPIPDNFAGLAFADDKLLKLHAPEAFANYNEIHKLYKENQSLAKKIGLNPSKYGLTSSAAAVPTPAPSALKLTPAPSLIPDIPKNEVLTVDGWKNVGAAKGSNPGGTYTDAQGRSWYVKTYADAQQARVEVLAARLYEATGIDVPDFRLATLNGKTSTASPILKLNMGEKLLTAEIKPYNLEEGFAVDAWLANWDVVGQSYDNIGVDAAGRAYRIDLGGSLLYRAKAGLKGDKFTDTVGELETFLSSKNPQSSAVFGDISPAKVIEGIDRVLAVSDAQIDELVAAAGLSDTVVAAKLKSRRESLRVFRDKYVAKAKTWEAEQAAKKLAVIKAQEAAAAAEAKANQSYADFSLSLDEDAAEIAARNSNRTLSSTDRHDSTFNKTGGTMDIMAKAQLAAIKAKKYASSDDPVNVFQTIHDYAGSSYKALRHSGSRGWYPAPSASYGIDPERVARMDAVNDFLKKLPTLDGITYRSFGNIKEKKHLDALLKGNTVNFKEVTSASTSASVSQGFLRAGNGDGFIFRIRSRNTGVPLFSEKLNEAAKKIGLRTDTGEQEVLMKRGSKFRVLSRIKVQSYDGYDKITQENNGIIRFPDGQKMDISTFRDTKANIWFIDLVEESLEAEYKPEAVKL